MNFIGEILRAAIERIDGAPKFVAITVMYLVFLVLLWLTFCAIRGLSWKIFQGLAELVRLVGAKTAIDGFEYFAQFFIILDSKAKGLSHPGSLRNCLYPQFKSARINASSITSIVTWPLSGRFGVRCKVVWSRLFLVLCLVVSLLWIAVKSLLHPVGIVSILVALYVENLISPIVEIYSSWHLQEPNLSTLLTFGSVVVFILVLFKVDIRGRAEFNKTASVQVRAQLHASIPDLYGLADTYAGVRGAALACLTRFPADLDVEEIARCDRLPNFGSGLALAPQPAPQGGGGWPECPSNVGSRLDSSFYTDLIKFVCDREEEIGKRILGLYESGVGEKIDIVVGLVGVGLIHDLRQSGFGRIPLVFVQSMSDQYWISSVLEDERSDGLATRIRELRDNPENATSELKENLIEQAKYLLVREIHESLWNLTVEEYRVRLLAVRIGGEIHPRFWSRLFQAIGK